MPADLPTPLVAVADPVLARAGVELRLKRDDLAHPTVPGNKWRKLAPNLERALAEGCTRLVTFGGAYSTHVRATAAAAQALGLACVGVIRGEELATAPRNWSLRAAEAAGMELEFVSRAEFRAVATGEYHDLERRWGRCLVLPEGGSNALAVAGAAEIPREIPDLGERDVVCCPVGTGGTLAGIAAGLPPGGRAMGVAVLRGEGYLETEVTKLHHSAYGREFANWRIHHGYHGGGYGRVPAELDSFAAEFEQRHGIAVERRYVAKMLHAVYGLAGTAALPPGSRATAVVTGLPDPV
ncbi:1-aminocyclopropane-1-carboxylate deaminase/D-cysteine desulfhydrase-like pyridoxal-dependent ACC family enzyme [Kitasatospora atroaurantiaca]|uniref:1-aminocyclopropane-1-carboxylate deaminase/D-cysteine desulfhydrase-like pyridoxal-dependent ACC family enzyme n=1 Tax=Kitasatospora atroaurantiaca TaxID=285545 RepID=A0A561EMU0_9ACTN|nr:1-aminocyclopropane-1-carboxylate deaminase/D-cysteine desulfhydrase-like pyridoxal-dependent ACC family enzyme [Kitasatospora atroaurantiaca]